MCYKELNIAYKNIILFYYIACFGYFGIYCNFIFILLHNMIFYSAWFVVDKVFLIVVLEVLYNTIYLEQSKV